jgi:hypothetical protein
MALFLVHLPSTPTISNSLAILQYYDSYCVSLLQYHPWFGAWTSLEYHNNLCFAVSFGADEGNQIGLARPKSAEQKKQK